MPVEVSTGLSTPDLVANNIAELQAYDTDGIIRGNELGQNSFTAGVPVLKLPGGSVSVTENIMEGIADAKEKADELGWYLLHEDTKNPQGLRLPRSPTNVM